ncbi:hypothetical protein BH10PSE13_BH10PSE13_18750 [soil metagenome]
MNNERTNPAQAAIDQILGLASEVEASGDAVVSDDHVTAVRAALHTWVDTVTGVAIVPALGRTTLVHANGARSSIQSSELSYALSQPVGPKQG